MSTPDQLEQPLTHSPQLRDIALAHLPKQVNDAQLEVTVTYRVGVFGEIELQLQYSPHNHVLDIDATETVYSFDATAAALASRTGVGQIMKWCELDSRNGEITGYGHGIVEEGDDEPHTPRELIAAQQDVWTFNASAERFFVKLFDMI